jgi:hypothetical protein
MEKIDEKDVKRHWKLLGHAGIGQTEMNVIYKNGKMLTRYVNQSEDFVNFCKQFSGISNVFSGMNPRPDRFSGRTKRAKDKDIEILSRILLDIEVEHSSGTDLPWEAVLECRPFAEMLRQYFKRRDFKIPYMNMSGNGWHLILCLCPTKVQNNTKDQLRIFFEEVKKDFQKIAVPKSNVRIDSTFDLSRLVKVAGTLSRKGTDKSLWRLSQADPRLDTDDSPVPDEKLTSYILGLKVKSESANNLNIHSIDNKLDAALMNKIMNDAAMSWLWTTNPKKLDGTPDRSVGDFVFILNCLNSEIDNDAVLRELLLRRPVGKGRVRFNDSYIEKTIERARAAKARCG